MIAFTTLLSIRPGKHPEVTPRPSEKRGADKNLAGDAGFEAAARDRLEAELLPANKTAIFDALASAGIVSVVVFFDGGGDSGQRCAIMPRASSCSNACSA